MSDILGGFNFEADDENTTSLDESGERHQQRNDDWLKVEKGTVVRAAMVLFYDVLRNAVFKYRNANGGERRNASKEELEEVAAAALKEHAEKLGKPVEKLTPLDRLDLTDAKVEVNRYFYKDGLGYVTSRLGKDGAAADQIWRSLGEEKRTFVTLLLVYPANSRGDLPKDEASKMALVTKCKLKKFRFSQKTFDSLMQANASLSSNNLSLAVQDVKLTCTDAKYKTVTATACGPAEWRNPKSPKFMREILEQAMAEYDKLTPFRLMTTAQLKEKLLEVGEPATSTSQSYDADAYINNA